MRPFHHLAFAFGLGMIFWCFRKIRRGPSTELEHRSFFSCPSSFEISTPDLSSCFLPFAVQISSESSFFQPTGLLASLIPTCRFLKRQSRPIKGARADSVAYGFFSSVVKAPVMLSHYDIFPYPLPVRITSFRIGYLPLKLL